MHTLLNRFRQGFGLAFERRLDWRRSAARLSIAVLMVNLVAGALFETRPMSVEVWDKLLETCHVSFAPSVQGDEQAPAKDGAATLACVFCLPLLQAAPEPVSQFSIVLPSTQPVALCAQTPDVVWAPQTLADGSSAPRAPPSFS